MLVSLSSPLLKLKTAFHHFTNPVLLLLCIGGALRNGAGIVWAYNIVLFFDEYHPGTNVSIPQYLLLIQLGHFNIGNRRRTG